MVRKDENKINVQVTKSKGSIIISGPGWASMSIDKKMMVGWSLRRRTWNTWNQLDRGRFKLQKTCQKKIGRSLEKWIGFVWQGLKLPARNWLQYSQISKTSKHTGPNFQSLHVCNSTLTSVNLSSPHLNVQPALQVSARQAAVGENEGQNVSRKNRRLLNRASGTHRNRQEPIPEDVTRMSPPALLLSTPESGTIDDKSSV